MTPESPLELGKHAQPLLGEPRPGEPLFGGTESSLTSAPWGTEEVGPSLGSPLTKENRAVKGQA